VLVSPDAGGPLRVLVKALLGQFGQQLEVGLPQRRHAARELSVEPPGLLGERAAEVDDREPVLRAGDQFVVRGQQFRVGVLVAAVAGQGEQVDRAAWQDDVRHTDGVAQAGHPELHGVRHPAREVLEVGVVLDVVTDQLPHRADHILGEDHRDVGCEAAEVVEQLPGRDEPDLEERPTDLPGDGRTVSSRPVDAWHAQGLADNHVWSHSHQW
jgi:hypothetical protein